MNLVTNSEACQTTTAMIQPKFQILLFNSATDNDYDYIYYGFPGEEEEENNGILHIVKTNSASSSSIAIRKYFPETWLWTEIANIRLNLF